MNDRRFDRTNGRKPVTCSWFRFYVYNPVRNVCCTPGGLIVDAWNVCRGAWYCEYCGKIHNRRVYKYNCLNTNLDTATGSLRDISDEPGRFVCSFGRDAVLHEGWRPQNVTLGDKLLSDLMTVGRAFNSRGN